MEISNPMTVLRSQTNQSFQSCLSKFQASAFVVRDDAGKLTYAFHKSAYARTINIPFLPLV